ncbi:MAG: DUF58 domain-containing protein [Anaerolineales bacterium]|nr:DUF58 domain-containing protein [Anaerolineales bacterium]
MNRIVLIGGIIYLLILAGLATLNGGLLILALPLLLYLSAGLLFAPQELNLHIERSIDPQRAATNTPIKVKLSITNMGSRLEEVWLEDLPPKELERLEGETSLITELPGGAKVELEYTLLGKRGIFRFSELRATAHDRLGITHRRRVFPTTGQIFVLPDTPRLRRVAIRPRQTRVYSGSIPARQGGSGIEFFGVRSYQMGDSMRHINWHVSARHQGELFSNEFEQERAADVWLILDARSRSNIPAAGESLFEHSIMAAASLAQALLTQSNRVGLLVYGGFLDWTYPGYGKIQNEYILRALARARTGESMVFDKLENLPTRVFPLSSQLILVSPLQYEDFSILIRLRARGYQVIVISPDPIGYEANELSKYPSGALAVRLARLERELLLRQLQQAGVHIFSWNVEIPFDQAMYLPLGRLLPWFHTLGARL